VKARKRAHARDYSRMLRDKILPSGPIQTICVDCGSEFGARLSTAKHCPDCRAIKSEIYHVIKSTRATFFAKAIAYPDEARALLDEIVAKEGQDFKELLLDGVFEKAKLKGGGL